MVAHSSRPSPSVWLRSRSRIDSATLRGRRNTSRQLASHVTGAQDTRQLDRLRIHLQGPGQRVAPLLDPSALQQPPRRLLEPMRGSTASAAPAEVRNHEQAAPADRRRQEASKDGADRQSERQAGSCRSACVLSPRFEAGTYSCTSGRIDGEQSTSAEADEEAEHRQGHRSPRRVSAP